MNAVFLQLSCRAKKNYYNSQGKKIKGNNKKKEKQEISTKDSRNKREIQAQTRNAERLTRKHII